MLIVNELTTMAIEKMSNKIETPDWPDFDEKNTIQQSQYSGFKLFKLWFLSRGIIKRLF
jgi:predicted oxidoreductase